MTDALGALERSFRQGSGRAVAALIRVTGDFDLAEEAVQDAFERRAAHLAKPRRAGQPLRLDRDDRAQPRDRQAPA